MKIVILTIIIAVANFSAFASEPVEGWTKKDVMSSMERASLLKVSDKTADPNFPDIQGSTESGFTVTIIRMACPEQPPSPDDLCKGAWLTVFIPTTEPRWAENIVYSIDKSGVFGINASTIDFGSGDGSKLAVSLSHYLAADGGVSPDLLYFQLGNLLEYTEQTREFLLSDDPAHEDLWAPAVAAARE